MNKNNFYSPFVAPARRSKLTFLAGVNDLAVFFIAKRLRLFAEQVVQQIVISW
jgi:hypothetical protein